MSSSPRPAVTAIDPACACACTGQEALALERLQLRIAQDLHDDLGGRLIAVKMALAPLLQNKNTADADAETVNRADRLLDEAIDAMHRVLHRLRPPELDLGLVAALQQMADDFRSSLQVCHFSSNQAEIDAAPALTIGLLRICREALANIGKHAQASRVDLRLTQSMADGIELLWLDIIDDGRGYPADAPDSASIAQRLQSLGGSMERRARTDGGSGCHLHIWVPIARPQALEADKIVR
jgi:two-component system sensor histidine kinase UhpB